MKKIIAIIDSDVSNEYILPTNQNNPCVAIFADHVSAPTDLTLSEDGYLLVTCGRDKVIYL